MLTGRLRHRVTIQANTPTQDAYNEPIDDWNNVDIVWANVQQRSGRETFDTGADQEVATIMYDVTMRARTDLALNPYTHRLVWGTKILDIHAVRDPDGRARAVVCDCRERVGDTTA